MARRAAWKGLINRETTQQPGRESEEAAWRDEGSQETARESIHTGTGRRTEANCRDEHGR